MRKSTLLVVSLLLSSLYAFITYTAAQQHHPLDPLTKSEFSNIRQLVLNSKLGSRNNLNFQYVGLQAPQKEAVYQWKDVGLSALPSRQAFVIARIAGETHEVLVDLTLDSIVYDKVYHGFGYPIFTLDEQGKASELILSYPPFIRSLKRRGLEIEPVVCTTYSIGWFGEKKQRKRKISILCSYRNGTDNIYARPLEGISAVVDLDTMKIIGYRDDRKGGHSGVVYDGNPSYSVSGRFSGDADNICIV